MKIYDSIIVGAGSAGITAAIYHARAGLNTALVERGLYGGVLHDTSEVENYTSYESISGMELAMRMEAHVKEQDNIDHIYGEVKEVAKEEGVFKVVINSDTLYSKAVVIATGVKYKKLDVKGEDEYKGRGVSNCITCDVNFFKDKNIAVIGGGDSAVEGVMQATNVVNEVDLVHRRSELRAQQILQDQMFSRDNVGTVWDANTTEIFGDGNKVEGIKYIDKKTGEEEMLFVDGVFVNIGVEPVTEFVDEELLDEEGFVKVDPTTMSTEIEGLFAIGDVRSGSIRQIVTATSDGALASEQVGKYLNDLK